MVENVEENNLWSRCIKAIHGLSNLNNSKSANKFIYVLQRIKLFSGRNLVWFINLGDVCLGSNGMNKRLMFDSVRPCYLMVENVEENTLWSI